MRQDHAQARQVWRRSMLLPMLLGVAHMCLCSAVLLWGYAAVAAVARPPLGGYGGVRCLLLSLRFSTRHLGPLPRRLLPNSHPVAAAAPCGWCRLSPTFRRRLVRSSFHGTPQWRAGQRATSLHCECWWSLHLSTAVPYRCCPPPTAAAAPYCCCCRRCQSCLMPASHSCPGSVHLRLLLQLRAADQEHPAAGLLWRAPRHLARRVLCGGPGAGAPACGCSLLTPPLPSRLCEALLLTHANSLGVSISCSVTFVLYKCPVAEAHCFATAMYPPHPVLFANL